MRGMKSIHHLALLELGGLLCGRFTLGLLRQMSDEQTDRLDAGVHSRPVSDLPKSGERDLGGDGERFHLGIAQASKAGSNAVD